MIFYGCPSIDVCVCTSVRNAACFLCSLNVMAPVRCNLLIASINLTYGHEVEQARAACDVPHNIETCALYMCIDCDSS